MLIGGGGGGIIALPPLLLLLDTCLFASRVGDRAVVADVRFVGGFVCCCCCCRSLFCPAMFGLYVFGIACLLPFGVVSW